MLLPSPSHAIRGIEKEQASKRVSQVFSFFEHEMVTSLMLDGENIKENSWNKLSHNERKIMTHNQVIALSTT